jgi:membrane protease YdiL (CAAX protease family)
LSLVTPSTPPGEDELQQPAVVLPEVPAREPAWGVLEVLALVPISFVVTILLTLLILIPIFVWMALHGSLNPGDKPSITVFARAALPAQALAYLLLMSGIKYLLARRGRPDLLKALHWNWPSMRVAVGLSCLAVTVAIIANAVSSHMEVPPNAPILEMLKDKVVAAMFVVFGVTVAPFAEELYFRGLLYPALQSRVGTAASVLITSLFFAVIHASQVANSLGPVGILLIVGLLLTIIRARTGSLAASFLFHVAYNSTLFIAGAFS